MNGYLDEDLMFADTVAGAIVAEMASIAQVVPLEEGKTNEVHLLQSPRAGGPILKNEIILHNVADTVKEEEISSQRPSINQYPSTNSVASNQSSSKSFDGHDTSNSTLCDVDSVTSTETSPGSLNWSSLLTPGCEVVAICGARKGARESKTKKQMRDEWQLADFCLFWKCIKDSGVNQTWLTELDIRDYCNTHSMLLHGSGSESDTRRESVFDATMPAFYTKVRSSKVIYRFRLALNVAFKRAKRVLVIIVAHGHPEDGGYVMLGGRKFYKHDLEILVPTDDYYTDQARVSLVSTACHSAHFHSPKWTSFVAAPKNYESLSFAESGSGRYHGGPFSSAFLSSLHDDNEDRLEEFGAKVCRLTLELFPTHPPPQHQIASWDTALTTRDTLPTPNSAPTTHKMPHQIHRTPMAPNYQSGTDSQQRLENLVQNHESNLDTTTYPSDMAIQHLIFRYRTCVLANSDLRMLFNLLSQRQALKRHVYGILKTLNVQRRMDIEEWFIDQNLASHRLYPAVSRLILHTDGMPYRKAALFLIFCISTSGRVLSEREVKVAIDRELD